MSSSPEDLKGKRAPDFELPTSDGRTFKLSEALKSGRYVVLYFYPMADTPGCTKEACGFRDALPDLSRLGAIVVGVSTDPPERNAKFAKKYGLNFTLLSDVDGDVSRAYGSFNPVFRKSRRHTFVIAPDGTVVGVFTKVNPAEHAREVEGFLRGLASQARASS